MDIRLPNNIEWASIQGGRPFIISNKKETLFDVAHVYDQRVNQLHIPGFDPELARKIGHYGLIVDTPADQLNNSLSKPSNILVGKKLAAITVPATMLVDKHGLPCSERSGSGAKSKYDRVTSEKEWLDFLRDRADRGYTFWRVQSDGNSLSLSNEGPLEDHID